MDNDKEKDEEKDGFFSTRGWEPFRLWGDDTINLSEDQSELPLETENEYLNRTILTRTRE